MPWWVPRARTRYLLQILLDGLIAMLSIVLALMMRFEFAIPAADLRRAVPVLIFAAVVQFFAGAASGLYVGRWRFGSFEEVAALARAVVGSTLLVAVTNRFVLGHRVPVSVTIAYGFGALVLMAAVRWVWRLAIERKMRPSGEDVTPVLVYGAGEAGAQLVTTMLRSRGSAYLPVAILDDDASKRSLRIMGVPVVGGRSDMRSAASRFGAESIVIALPSAGAEVMRSIAQAAAECRLPVLVLPSVTELLGSSIGLSDIRPITEVDLLGRRVVDTDVDAIAGYLTGRRVLVTGAGGSIGSELCRQLYRFAPSSLVMLERDESALHAVQLSIEGRAMLDSRNLVVCDIRDRERLDQVFTEHRPEVVFHAAALKHLPLLQMHPSEAFKTNCLATENLLAVSQDHGVERFVNISTDKAADPISVLGFTKRIAERLTAAAAVSAAAHHQDSAYLSVRFGNVLGSRGSVLTAFRAQIEAGGPVTVTDPRVTRYFMTIEEAVQLVIQAGAVGRGGEALVLDMGEPVRIDDVARRLIERADRRIEITYTGLRPGEKMHEVLLGQGERDERPNHPLIAQVPVPPLGADQLRRVAIDGTDEEIIADLARMCGPVEATIDLLDD